MVKTPPEQCFHFNPVGCFILGILLPGVMGIVIGHYKDPYSPISNIECHVRVSNVAHLLFVMIKGDVYCSKP